MFRILLCILCSGFLSACTPNKESPSGQEGKLQTSELSPKKTAQKDLEDSNSQASKKLFGKASVSGTVLFKGKVPESKKDPSAGFPECRIRDGKNPPADFEKRHNPIRVQGDRLQNAFVYVKEGISDSAVYPTPDRPVHLDQEYCAYVPRVLGMQTNQTLLLVNSDPGLHNVHSQAKNSKNFNLGMPIKDMKMSRTFANKEIMVKVKCDVHPWMAAYVGVLRHPFFDVTGAEGSFEIPKLPAGEYTLEVWHETLGTLTKVIRLDKGQTATVEFEFKK